MKNSMLAISFLFVSTFAMADISEQHNKNCAEESVKKVVGETGSCRIVIAPKPTQKTGSCTGLFQNVLPCTTTFSPELINLSCGSDPTDLVLNQDLDVSFLGYNVSTLLKTSEGKDVVLSDKTEYSLVFNNMLSVHLAEKDSITTGKISLVMESGVVELSNVFCQ